MKTLYLIDAYGFLYRAFHSMPPLTNPQNISIGAVYGYTKLLLKLIQERKPDFAVVAYDNHLPTLRKQAYPEYKGGRSKNLELEPQFALARDASRALGFLGLEAEGYEADDLIATLAVKAQKAGMKVIIVSSDKDLMQLVNENVTMWDAMRDKVYDVAAVTEKWGVPPHQLADVLALIGDVADNIKGVPKIGTKGAARLIREFGDLERLLNNAHEIAQPAQRESLEDNGHIARQARQLVELYYDAPIYLNFDDMQVSYNKDQVLDFCHKHDFKSIISRL